MSNTKAVAKFMGLAAASAAVTFGTLTLMLFIFLWSRIGLVPGFAEFREVNLLTVWILGVGASGMLILVGLHYLYRDRQSS